MKHRNWEWTFEAIGWCLLLTGGSITAALLTIFTAYLFWDAFVKGVWFGVALMGGLLLTLSGVLLVALYGVYSSAREVWFGRA